MTPMAKEIKEGGEDTTGQKEKISGGFPVCCCYPLCHLFGCVVRPRVLAILCTGAVRKKVYASIGERERKESLSDEKRPR